METIVGFTREIAPDNLATVHVGDASDGAIHDVIVGLWATLGKSRRREIVAELAAMQLDGSDVEGVPSSIRDFVQEFRDETGIS